jgi:hypothetical protein
MTAVTFRGADLTAAVIHALELAGYTVGDGEAPKAAGWQGALGASNYVPYTVVHPIPGGITDGTIADPNVDVAADYQIISVGATRVQAETVGDGVRAVMLQTRFPLSGGRSFIHIHFDMTGGAIRDDTVQPSVYYVTDRYRLWTVPT